MHPQTSGAVKLSLNTPGFERVRNIKIMGDAGSGYASHAEIWYRGVRVPVDNRLGPEGAGFLIAQDRLGPGRYQRVGRGSRF